MNHETLILSKSYKLTKFNVVNINMQEKRICMCCTCEDKRHYLCSINYELYDMSLDRTKHIYDIYEPSI